jgi:hypothetical protein
VETFLHVILDLRQPVRRVVAIHRLHPVWIPHLCALVDGVVLKVPHLAAGRGEGAQLARVGLGIGGHVAVVIRHAGHLRALVDGVVLKVPHLAAGGGDA